MGFNYLFIFPSSYVALCGSKAHHRLSSESVSWCLETSLFLRLLSRDGAPSLPLLSLFLSYIFFPTSFGRQWAAFLGAWCPLPAFRSCFVEFTQRLNVLLMNLWGRKWSPSPIPPPFLGPPLKFKDLKNFQEREVISQCRNVNCQMNGWNKYHPDKFGWYKTESQIKRTIFTKEMELELDLEKLVKYRILKVGRLHN